MPWATSRCGQRNDRLAQRKKQLSIQSITAGWLARPRNIILSQLPEAEYAALAKSLVPVELSLGQKLSEPNEPIEYVYFLNSGLISTDALTKKGESVEVGVIGREGFSGLPALLDQPQMSHAVVIQGIGNGLRIRSSIVRDEFRKGGVLQQLVHAFSYLQLVQVTQSVLCNRMHEVEGRLCRWLLTSADRMESDELNLTQEFLAQMLGVQRSTVTVAASALQRAGYISYSRGKILLLDRENLAKAACECYDIVRESYDRMLQLNDKGNLAYVISPTDSAKAIL
jgi:CRP-like cAMP-binding protein